MDPVANSVLLSWRLDPHVIAALCLVAIVYVRGWIRGRRLIRTDKDFVRLAAFLGGLLLLFIALESPLDAFDTLFLSAHMTQHLLLMMFAPPLVLLGHPLLPMLRGLPKRFVKEALGPFLTWPALRRIFSALTFPAVTWLLFACSTIFWHLRGPYQLAVLSPFWHGLQHASFFWTGVLFWWPVIQPGPGRPRWPRWVAIPYLLFADLVNTAISACFVFGSQLLYPYYGTIRASHVSPLDDQVLAGLIMWVPGSIVYLVPAFVMTMSVIAGPQWTRARVEVRRMRASVRQHGRSLKPAAKWRRVAQSAMLLLAIAIMADGFFGTQIAPLNLAGVLPWIHWRAFSILALLIVGNLFCMACPFTLVRDWGRRVLPARLRWPRQLRSKWLAAVLFLLYLWTYEAFGLWDSPWLTAWVIAGYFLAALTIDGLFRGASFCKYVCPIGQFHFVSSLMSPREIAVKRPEVCRSCHTHDCIRGNTQHRGCELYLFQPKKAGNLDCTFCLDCVQACPQDNVGLVAITPAKSLTTDPYRSSIGRLSKRTDLAALALLVTFGGFVNAAGMVQPVMRWEHAWHARLGPNMMPLIVGAFVLLGAVVLPLVAVTSCWFLNRTSADVARRFVFALVPIGVSMWAAHLLYHLAIGWAGPWGVPIAPDWLTSVQILVLDAGLLTTLYVAWRIASRYARRMLAAPWAVLACALYAAGIWILLQPMQMRGMMH